MLGAPASSRAAVRFVLGRRIGGLLGADADPVELHQAIRHAAAGHNYMAGPASRFTVGELHSFGEQSVFELLTSQQRVVVHYTLVVGLSRREVAELCGISLATVRSHLHDARQRLRGDLR